MTRAHAEAEKNTNTAAGGIDPMNEVNRGISPVKCHSTSVRGDQRRKELTR